MSGVSARATVEQAVRRELFGPLEGESHTGKPVNCDPGHIAFVSMDASAGQFYDESTGQEVLTRGDPLHRYGVGVLHSGGAPTRSSSDAEADLGPGLPTSEDDLDVTPIAVRGQVKQDEPDADDFDLSDANRRKPSSMAVSFKVRLSPGSSLLVRATGAYYDAVGVTVPGAPPLRWWVRRPFVADCAIEGARLLGGRRRIVPSINVTSPVSEARPRMAPTVSIFSRAVPGVDDPNVKLVTVALINNVIGSGAASALFQVGFSILVRGGAAIEPYPRSVQDARDEEDESIDLLYRFQRTYAVGHGCAADWGTVADAETAKPYVTQVLADALPAHEVTSLTPDVFEEAPDGIRIPVTVSMEELGRGSAAGSSQVNRVLELYAAWIADRRASIDDLPPQFSGVAARHMDGCEAVLNRMREGWGLAQHHPIAARAFRLANQAMLFQQLRSRLPPRDLVLGADKVYRASGRHPVPEPDDRSGRWRAFQIAFILASLPELVDRAHPNRALVDLIYFPTGGGKTEAYLGASAISLIARRLRDPDDAGTDTLMRYTLRLLTAQQFLRASSLICVLEDLRSQAPEELGTVPFSIGVWLGGDSTPNTWAAAERSLKMLIRDFYAPNKFLLLKCPWCGAKMAPIRKQNKGQDVPAYIWTGKK